MGRLKAKVEPLLTSVTVDYHILAGALSAARAGDSAGFAELLPPAEAARTIVHTSQSGTGAFPLKTKKTSGDMVLIKIWGIF